MPVDKGCAWKDPLILSSCVSLSDHADLFFNCPQGNNAASTVASSTSPCCSKSFMLSPPTEVWFGALRERDKARLQAGR